MCSRTSLGMATSVAVSINKVNIADLLCSAKAPPNLCRAQGRSSNGGLIPQVKKLEFISSADCEKSRTVLPLHLCMKVGARFHVELCDSGDSGAGMWAHEALCAWLQGPCLVLSHLQPHLSLGRVVSHTHMDTQSVSLSAVLQRHSWVATWA